MKYHAVRTGGKAKPLTPIRAPRCQSGGSAATVLAADRLEIPFGNAATVRLSISEDGLLVFDAYRVHALHKRVVPSDICRRSDGSYFEGAPHIAQTP